MMFKKLLTITVFILSTSVFTACESKGPAEKAGEKIDRAVQETIGKAKEVTKAVGEEVEEAGNAVKKATQ